MNEKERNNRENQSNPDATVIGGGLAGMAAAIHLARGGLRVLCITAGPPATESVWESLDWSAPDLLGVLGLSMERLIEQGAATFKRHVVLRLEDGSQRDYVPSDWLGRPPLNIDLRTLHVDRTQLAAALYAIGQELNIDILVDKVISIEKRGRGVEAVTTESGVRITSPWFIDASGGNARLFSRAFDLPAREYGPTKVAVWDYFDMPTEIEGTTLYANCGPTSYLEWLWQIPIRPSTVSVGYVATGEAIKEMRQRGLSISDIYESQLQHLPPLRALLGSGVETTPRVTSFRCRVHRNVSGPNWLIAGEAASMVDPMTSNGVTAALRHAAEAASIIIKNQRSPHLPVLTRAAYDRRVRGLASFLNIGIEKVVYDWPVRNWLGPLNAGDLYTVPAWSMNHLYSRLRPRGLTATLMFCSILSFFGYAASALHWWSRWILSSRGPTGRSTTNALGGSDAS
jgi:flavin-dependent dehydrogenase